eukprot:5496696-Prymnesium_polylepis.1
MIQGDGHGGDGYPAMDHYPSSVISRDAVGPWAVQRSDRGGCASLWTMDVKPRPPKCYAPHEVAGSRGGCAARVLQHVW